jgi:hypothetical protein
MRGPQKPLAGRFGQDSGDEKVMRYHGASPNRKRSPKGRSAVEGRALSALIVAANVIERATLQRAMMTARARVGSSEHGNIARAQGPTPALAGGLVVLCPSLRSHQ